MADTPADGHKDGTSARLLAVLSAKAPQFVGLYLAVKESGREQVRDVMIIAAVIFVVGAQAAQEIALRVIDRVFGHQQP